MRPVLLVLAFVAGLVLSACPGPRPPAPPAACTAITEDEDAPDHCSTSKEECERVLSRIHSDAHANRCPVPPCTSYSAWTECFPTGDECPIGENGFGQRFTTREHLRCR